MTVTGFIAYLIFLPTVVVSVAYGTALVYQSLDIPWLGAYLVSVNVSAFVFYTYDKAISDLLETLHLTLLPLRVPENVLVWLLAFPAGTLGSVVAMFALDHKTGERKIEFRLKLLQAYALQFALLIASFVAMVVWDMAPLKWLDTVVEAAVGIVLDITRMLMSMVGV